MKMRHLILFLISSMLSSFAAAKDPVVEQMISTYKANEARFHMNHRGQTLSGEGVVTGIRTDSLGTGYKFYVSINVNDSKVNCDTRNQQVAASLDKGKKIKFSGRVHDVVFSSLDVRDCSFSEPEKAKLSRNNNQSSQCDYGKECKMSCKGKIIRDKDFEVDHAFHIRLEESHSMKFSGGWAAYCNAGLNKYYKEVSAVCSIGQECHIEGKMLILYRWGNWTAITKVTRN